MSITPSSRALSGLRKEIIYRVQRIGLRADTASLELRHQANYFELARRTDWLYQAPFSSPGGAANFSLLYVLLAALRTGAFSRILEIGVGLSTDIITSYVRETQGASSVHVDQDKTWLERSVPDHPRVQPVYGPLIHTKVGSKAIEWYDCPRPEGTFDFVLVDAPNAFRRSEQGNRQGVLAWLPQILANEFVLVFDDATRAGERHAVTQAEALFAAEGISVARREFTGINSQTVFATHGYEFVCYL